MKNNNSSRLIPLIDDYIAGKLGPEDVDRLWAELLENPEYYQILRTRATLQKQYEQQSGNPSSTKEMITTWNQRNKRTLATLITMAAMLLIALFATQHSWHGPADVSSHLSEIKPLHLISPEVTRSSESDMSLPEIKLQNAYLFSLSGDFEMAITEYQDLKEQGLYPDTISYNLGITYFNTGDYRNAAVFLSEANCNNFSQQSLQENCYWFRTKAYLADGNSEEARKSAEATLEIGERWNSGAYEILEEINRK